MFTESDIHWVWSINFPEFDLDGYFETVEIKDKPTVKIEKL